MKRLFLSLYAVLAIGAACLAALAPAQAAVVMQAHGASVSYVEFAGDGDLSAFDAVVDDVTGLAPVGTARLSFGIGFSLAAPGVDFGGGLTVLDDSGLLLGGDLLALASTPNTITFTLGNLGGSGASLFGSHVSGMIEFDPFLAADPFSALRDGQAYTATIRLAGLPVAVSAPGGLWLVSGGLLAMVLVRRRITSG